MKTMTRYLVCTHCGNVAEKLYDGGVDIVCCGDPMAQLTANTTDAAQEKHVPSVKLQVNTVYVQVGSVPHPMQEDHYIGWIWLETDKGGYRRALVPGDAPRAEFTFQQDETPVAVYAWCNLHGLWKLDDIKYGELGE